ncbi:uncharacterized protein [Drosophila virilis]|uniref:MADF domain-containing protein n=1 Tax=Drosophila virilis TaxID=7244 RepID=B4LRG2_DROVI|nr:uncharacterized protein LOC6627455 [Drosophila virilis]EDW64632.2 uncharacterized protein Dvir_GJ21368 [Drosophila virilis]
MSKNNKVVWTDEILFFIIKHVKVAPFVWDHSHPQFAYKSKKAKFWSLLAEKVNAYGGFFSATPITKEALQKKWTNMKTYYLFEESKSRRIGADADNFSTTWKFRSTLSFLSSALDTPASRPQQQPTTSEVSTCGGTILPANPSESSFDLSEDDPLATQDCLPPNITIKTEEPSAEDPPALSEHENEEEEEEPLSPVRKRPKEATIMEVRTPRKAHKSYFYHYGMTVAQDLDQLDEDYKIDAKLEIMQIIAKYKREQYLNQTDS